MTLRNTRNRLLSGLALVAAAAFLASCADAPPSTLRIDGGSATATEKHEKSFGGTKRRETFRVSAPPPQP